MSTLSRNIVKWVLASKRRFILAVHLKFPQNKPSISNHGLSIGSSMHATAQISRPNVRNTYPKLKPTGKPPWESPNHHLDEQTFCISDTNVSVTTAVFAFPLSSKPASSPNPAALTPYPAETVMRRCLRSSANPP